VKVPKNTGLYRLLPNRNVVLESCIKNFVQKLFLGYNAGVLGVKPAFEDVFAGIFWLSPLPLTRPNRAQLILWRIAWNGHWRILCMM
jgi:hypothetical protein